MDFLIPIKKDLRNSNQLTALIGFCILLSMFNNVFHISSLYHLIHTENKIDLDNEGIWSSLNWYQGLITVLVFDTSVILLLFCERKKEAKIMAIFIFIFNLLYLDVIAESFILCGIINNVST